MTNDDRVRQAYRAAAQASGEPSPQLDARILQAAHAALQKPAHKPARWSWLALPFSAAAVAILVTTLVLQSRQAPPAPSAVASAPVTTPGPQAIKPEQPNAAKVADAKPAPKAKRRVDEQQQQALQIAAAEDAAKAERRSESAAYTDAAEQAQQKMQDAKIAAAPAPTSNEPAAPAPTPVAAAAPPQVASVPPPPAEQLAEAQHAQTRAPKVEALGALAKARSADQPTEKQIAEIRKLLREGQRDAAKKSLAELRKKFPQYTVPEDLRALIEPAAEENKARP